MSGDSMLTALSSVITAIGQANTFLWGLFSDFLTMILNNALIAFPVLFVVLTGAIGVVVRVLRKFGVKGKVR